MANQFLRLSDEAGKHRLKLPPLLAVVVYGGLPEQLQLRHERRRPFGCHHTFRDSDRHLARGRAVDRRLWLLRLPLLLLALFRRLGPTVVGLTSSLHHVGIERRPQEGPTALLVLLETLLRGHRERERCQAIAVVRVICDGEPQGDGTEVQDLRVANEEAEDPDASAQAPEPVASSAACKVRVPHLWIQLLKLLDDLDAVDILQFPHTLPFLPALKDLPSDVPHVCLRLHPLGGILTLVLHLLEDDFPLAVVLLDPTLAEYFPVPIIVLVLSIHRDALARENGPVHELGTLELDIELQRGHPQHARMLHTPDLAFGILLASLGLWRWLICSWHGGGPVDCAPLWKK
mmetsp:Transcript_31500/g.68965  ORF Transcript_31500/g.68965 Transcript_31500/m.68965 type:complete len:346 (+) Transcript_31500:249-1286(+)